MEQKYKEDYEEVQCIGRGNFGKFINAHSKSIIFLD